MLQAYQVKVKRIGQIDKNSSFTYYDYSLALDSFIQRITSLSSVMAMCPGVVIVELIRGSDDNPDYNVLKSLSFNSSDWLHEAF